MSKAAALSVETPAGEVLAAEEIHRAVERFLYREARLLDTEQLREWLAQMVGRAIRYTVVSRQLRSRKDKRYTAQPAEMYIYDDDYGFLEARVEQSYSPMAWRLDPPERYRRLIGNIEVFETGRADEYAVRSYCHATRARRGLEVDTFVCCRDDILLREPGGAFKLIRRFIDFDQRSVLGRNLALFL